MKSHELEALRRLLFFSVPEAAAMIGGVSEQAWRRWESGSRSVPEDVSARMQALSDWRQHAIDAAIRQISAAPDAAITLLWYSSLDDWATLPGRDPALWRPQQSACAAVFSEIFGRAHLVQFDAPAYSSWLSGRDDSESTRSQWAATEHMK